jgi:autoinducer 2 (AI-2) kinase
MAVYFLALDAGTGSVRAVLFDEKGKIATQAAREWIHVAVKGYPGSMEFDSAHNWQLACQCIQEVLQTVKAEDVSALSCTSMREGIALFDKKGHELWACANVDARAVEQVLELRSHSKDFEMEVYTKSGQTFALGAAPRLLWLRKYLPEIYEKIYAVCMLSDWLAIKLGAPLSVDPSNGGTTGLFTLEDRNWSSALIEKCGLASEMFHAQVFESGTAIGEVSQQAGLETGLKPGTMIVMGGGDAQLGSLGVGAINPGDVAMFGGTFWQQEFCLDEPVSDPSGKLRINFHAVPHRWQIETISFFVGLAVRWFRDAMCPDIVELGKKKKTDPYTLLSEMAEAVPAGSHGIISIFSDSMNYLHWRHAAPSFLNIGVDPKMYHRGTLFRALMENAGIVAKANMDLIFDLTGKIPQKVLFAGGAAKSRLWQQIVADILQRPVIVPKVIEATALGAAMCAAVGSKHFSNIDESVKNWVSYGYPLEPNKENAPVYQESLKKWEAAYPKQMELADKGVTNHMWLAPGE